jgi:hypothetical protein
MATNTKTVCVACRHLIPEGASKCAKCDTLQSPWRFLSIGQNGLALVIALVSVIGVVGERLYNLAAGDYSDIRMAVVESDELGVTMLASNSGNRAGVLSGAQIEVVGSWGNALFDLDVAGKAVFVEPGKDLLVEFKPLRPESLSVLLDEYLEEVPVSNKKAQVYDCLITVEHILYEDTQDLEPMNASSVDVPGAKGSPERSFLTRSLVCSELGLGRVAASLHPADETSEKPGSRL